MQLQHTKKSHPAAYLFGGIFLTYLAFSPGSVASMGYTSEELRAGSELLSNAVAWIRGNSLTPIDWPRHGLLPVLFDLPFVALGSHLRGRLNQDWVASFEPVLLTGLLVMVLFLWLRRLTSPGWSYLLALIAGFCTMLWPYAYTGLEVKQSLALMLAGYLGLSHEHKITWPRGLLFAACCGVAISVKASGTFLIPAVLFLVGYFYWRASFSELRKQLPKLLATLAIILGVFLSNYAVRSLFFTRNGGQGHFFRFWLVDSPTAYFLQLVGYFGSPNKGLIVYAPIVLLSFLAFPRVLKEYRALAIFTLLVLGGLAGGHALQKFYVDDTWGPRYLHSAIAPLILCVGATRERLHARTVAPVLVLAAMGFWVSFLGTFFWYGVTHRAAISASQSTLETLQGDIVWNPILFEERLLFYRLHRGPESWVPDHTWWFEKPPDIPEIKPVNLAEYAVPQPFLIHFRHTPFHGGLRRLWYFYFLCLPAGVLLLVTAGWQAIAEAEPRVDGSPTATAATVMPREILRKLRNHMGPSKVPSPDWSQAEASEAVLERSGAIQYPAYNFVKCILLVGALILLAALARKGWLDVDTGWDSLAYHMQFAALRVGLITQQQYHLSSWISGYYDGFPVVPDYLQGILWRLTSRPQAANLVSLVGLICVSVFFRARYKIPFGYIVIAFLGIPVVFIQSTSTFVDLFTNCFALLFLFTVFNAWTDPTRFSMLDALGAFLSLAIVINSKAQFLVVGTAALLGFMVVMYVNRRSFTLLQKQLQTISAWKRYVFFLICFLSLCAAYVNPVKNLLRFHNPIYPVSAHIGRMHLRGNFPLAAAGHEPAYLSSSWQWARWVLSIVEYDAFDGRPVLWTNAQGDVKQDSPALRMGGSFGALVLFNLFLFLILQARSRGRFGLKPMAFLVVITIMTAVLPSSHEIRYYMYWVMCLVALNLVMIESGLEGSEQNTFRLVAAAAMSSFLLFVLCATGFQYVLSTGTTMDTLIRDYGIGKQLSDMHLQEGETICVEGKNPRDFLYAPNFNPALEAQYHYRVLEAYAPGDCMGKRVVP